MVTNAILMLFLFVLLIIVPYYFHCPGPKARPVPKAGAGPKAGPGPKDGLRPEAAPGPGPKAGPGPKLVPVLGPGPGSVLFLLQALIPVPVLSNFWSWPSSQSKFLVPAHSDLQ